MTNDTSKAHFWTYWFPERLLPGWTDLVTYCIKIMSQSLDLINECHTHTNFELNYYIRPYTYWEIQFLLHLSDNATTLKLDQGHQNCYERVKLQSPNGLDITSGTKMKKLTQVTGGLVWKGDQHSSSHNLTYFRNERLWKRTLLNSCLNDARSQSFCCWMLVVASSRLGWSRANTWFCASLL